MIRVCARGGTIILTDIAISRKKRQVYDRVEKLKGPSYIQTMTPEEFIRLAEKHRLTDSGCTLTGWRWTWKTRFMHPCWNHQ